MECPCTYMYSITWKYVQHIVQYLWNSDYIVHVCCRQKCMGMRFIAILGVNCWEVHCVDLWTVCCTVNYRFILICTPNNSPNNICWCKFLTLQLEQFIIVHTCTLRLEQYIIYMQYQMYVL